MGDDDRRLACATYTHARRHPMVLGKIGDWTPPFQVTFPQLAVILVVLAVEYLTWGLWAAHLPIVVAMVLFVGVPGALSWVVRRARIEGRSLVRAGLGWAVYAVRSAWDDLTRSQRSQPRYLEHGVVYVASGEPVGGGRAPTPPTRGELTTGGRG